MDSGVIESRTGSIDLDRLPLRLIKERARALLERVHRLENETNYLKFIKLNQFSLRLAPLINLIFTSNIIPSCLLM